ncbi:hypothetical protein [Deinococcus wulumuqiensis]|uniref:hypothetical protein n=1 Tax=Deinococcus wulumuqiensis TaxID=980427 RepID=UPI002430B506|nr:hypothetical protein [Deinococcus wulumuqiensis]
MFKLPPPRWRPRAAPFRVMTVLLSAVLGGYLLLLLSTFLSDDLGAVDWIVVPLLLLPLLLGARAYAYSGGPQELGAVAAPLQLWRDPRTRTLPELPPLPRWKVALHFLVPLLVSAGLLIWMLPDVQRRGQFSDDLFWRRAAVEDMERTAANVGFIRVGCQDFPVPTRPESLCFIAPPDRAPSPRQPLAQALPQWVGENLSWIEIDFKHPDSDPNPVRHDVAAPPLAFRRGGGVVGVSTQLDLPVTAEAGKAPVLGAFQLDGLERTGPPSGTVPATFAAQERWLRAQVFGAYFVVTPLK